MKQFIYEMSLLEENRINSIDLFFLAGGSDHRAYEILRKCSEIGISIKKIIQFDFQERINAIKDNDSYYDYKEINYYLENTNNFEFISCSIIDPVSCLSELSAKFSKFNKKNIISIDISCFTKPYFFYLLKYFKSILDIHNLSVFYTEPFSYRFPNKGLFSSYSESKGPVEIMAIPGYNGIGERGLKKTLVVQLGFEVISLDEIIMDYSPNTSFFINGFPSYSQKFKDISLVINESYTSHEKSKILYCKANNPFDTYNLLDTLKKENKGTFINIAPLGTKPMALGACLFAIHHPEVKVIFPFPETYEKITSDQCWNSWMYHLPLKFI